MLSLLRARSNIMRFVVTISWYSRMGTDSGLQSVNKMSRTGLVEASGRKLATWQNSFTMFSGCASPSHRLAFPCKMVMIKDCAKCVTVRGHSALSSSASISSFFRFTRFTRSRLLDTAVLLRLLLRDDPDEPFSAALPRALLALPRAPLPRLPRLLRPPLPRLFRLPLPLRSDPSELRPLSKLETLEASASWGGVANTSKSLTPAYMISWFFRLLEVKAMEHTSKARFTMTSRRSDSIFSRSVQMLPFHTISASSTMDSSKISWRLQDRKMSWCLGSMVRLVVPSSFHLSATSTFHSFLFS
mmetsp:Transcript_91765/g.182881  ORF Transcript_91765/g.182881 Transcript_91765/m.182881 type:complete len:301 (+) Transcript_91765:2327-3229(+)